MTVLDTGAMLARSDRLNRLLSGVLDEAVRAQAILGAVDREMGDRNLEASRIVSNLVWAIRQFQKEETALYLRERRVGPATRRVLGRLGTRRRPDSLEACLAWEDSGRDRRLEAIGTSRRTSMTTGLRRAADRMAASANWLREPGLSASPHRRETLPLPAVARGRP